MCARRVVTTRRRDSQPVRVYRDGRLTYWSGGVVGAGERRFERLGSLEAAEARAAEVRSFLAAEVAPREHRTLREVAQRMLDELRDAGQPEGTVRQYKSNWNTWMDELIGDRLCQEATIREVKSVMNQLNASKATLGTVNAVIRTLSAVIRTGQHCGWLLADDLGSPALRHDVFRVTRQRAADRGRNGEVITVDMCPTLVEIDSFAAAMLEQYPVYGDLLVYAAFSCGARLCELLALEVGDVDLVSGVVRIERQLDRYGNWPETRPPKGGKARRTVFWASYQDVWERLVQSAKDEGRAHLFPRHRSTTKFADRVGVFSRHARTESDIAWGFHWLRHAYATWSLAHEQDGGYGLDLASVSKWLGHNRTSTTQDMYVSPIGGHEERARAATARPVGTSGR